MNSALWLQKDLEKQQAEQNLKDAYKTIKIFNEVLSYYLNGRVDLFSQVRGQSS